MLRFLHLSDIHFKSPDCLTPRMDADSADRELLIKDVVALTSKKDKRIDGILVTGDITFKAAKEEFGAADKWFEKLAKALNISTSTIRFVPGNHDIDRNIANEPMVRAARQSILQLEGQQRDDYFLKLINDKESQHILTKPMREYNQFASNYNCKLALPNQPFWEHRIAFDAKYELCINGLTTTFFSSEEDTHKNLYMGTMQANFELEAGTIHLAMFHHPTDWLVDGNEVEDMLADNAQISLTGHEHRQRHQADPRYLNLPSAAVNPSRYESGQSGYNLLELEVVELELEARLDITVTMRTLQDSPKRYIIRETHDGKDKLQHSITIAKSTKNRLPDVSVRKPTTINSSQSEPTFPQDYVKKNVIKRLWQLDASKRREVFDALPLESRACTKLSEQNYVRESLREVNRLNLTDLFEKKLNEQE